MNKPRYILRDGQPVPVRIFEGRKLVLVPVGPDPSEPDNTRCCQCALFGPCFAGKVHMTDHADCLTVTHGVYKDA